MNTIGPWYVGSTSNHQGHIACEQTGVSIAVTYDKKDASLIAAAPDLLAALEDAEFLMRQAGKRAGPMQDSFKRSAYDARTAIEAARGQS